MEDLLLELEKMIEERRDLSPDESYVARKLKGPESELYRKLPEEAVEIVLACTVGGDLKEEFADLWFHALLIMAKHGVSVEEVAEVLRRRRKGSRSP